MRIDTCYSAWLKFMRPARAGCSPIGGDAAFESGFRGIIEARRPGMRVLHRRITLEPWATSRNDGVCGGCLADAGGAVFGS